jgi:hypothetical protein
MSSLRISRRITSSLRMFWSSKSSTGLKALWEFLGTIRAPLDYELFEIISEDYEEFENVSRQQELYCIVRSLRMSRRNKSSTGLWALWEYLGAARAPLDHETRSAAWNWRFILFICSLFYDALSVTRTIQGRMKGWKVNDEFKEFGRRSWTNFNKQSRHSPGRAQWIHEKPQLR